MPSPDELRQLAERAKELADETERLIGMKARYLGNECEDLIECARPLADAVLDLLAENERLRNTCKLGRDTILIATACCAQSPGEEREIEASIRAIDAVLEEPTP